MGETGQTANRVVFQFTGEGPQHVGMGKALAERFACGSRTSEEADDVVGQ